MTYDWTSAFEAERRHLFGIAYRMLGSASEAEDVLQDAWLKVQRTEEAPRSAKSFLATVVIRLSIDALQSSRARRESYVGPWLPEPVLGPAEDDADRRLELLESVSMAMLVVLESLSPLERAAFLLREVFDWGFDEIALVLGRSEPAVRQLFHRAREHVVAKKPRYRASDDEARRLSVAFLSAVASGDVGQVASLLAEDAVTTSDGGGRVQAARKPVFGRERVAAFYVGLAKKADFEVRVELVTVNGAAGYIAYTGDRILHVAAFGVEDGLIRTIHVVVNPEKLAHLPPRDRCGGATVTPRK